MQVKSFQREIWSYYKKHKRSFPWRNTHNPYKILVSEVMLQQTQTSRVILKYKEFLHHFPTFKVLANAKFQDVLKVWQGLGYNRRALNLKRAAEIITQEYKGTFPKNFEVAKKLPGIGQSTAGAVLAFAYNIPTVFIETNIRAVYLHFFFKNKKNVKDKDLVSIIEKTKDVKNSCEWYYALMDYGVLLKKSETNPSRNSSHYKKQSPFKGSNREIRSGIIKHILINGSGTLKDFSIYVGRREILPVILTSLVKEGLIRKIKNKYYIS